MGVHRPSLWRKSNVWNVKGNTGGSWGLNAKGNTESSWGLNAKGNTESSGGLAECIVVTRLASLGMLSERSFTFNTKRFYTTSTEKLGLFWHEHQATIGVARGHTPLQVFSISSFFFFERRNAKQNTAPRLKSKNFPPTKILGWLRHCKQPKNEDPVCVFAMEGNVCGKVVLMKLYSNEVLHSLIK